MGYIIIIMYGIILLYGLRLKWYRATQLIIVVCFYQNIVLVFLSRAINSTQFTVLALGKEIYLVLYIFIKIISNKKINKREAFCLIGILFLASVTVISNKGTMIGRLSSFRQLYLPFAFFLFGDIGKVQPTELRTVAKTYIINCIVAVGFGFLEMFSGTLFWINAGLSNYAQLKGVTSYMHISGVMRSFITYDFGVPMRRMASTLVDPVILGQLLGFGFLIVTFDKKIFNSKKKKLLCTLIIGLGLLLTFAKGGVVIAIIGSCILLRDISNKKIMSNLLLLVAIIVGAALIVIGIKNESSVSAHLNGIISGFGAAINRPIGNGIGSSGNAAARGGGLLLVGGAGTESFIGSMAAQLGFPGLFLFGIFWIMLFRYFRLKKIKHINFQLKKFSQEGNLNLSEIIYVSNIGLFITAFVNNTAISFMSCFMFFSLICPVKKTLQ